MTTAIYTIVSNNYLHFARTLLQSVRKQHPDCDLYCVVVDTDPSPALAHETEFRVLNLLEIGLPDLQRFTFQYTVLELNTAVKPWAMEALLAKGHSEVVYIDPDIYLYRPLNEVFSAFESGADIVITPHLLSPIRDDRKPSELDIRRAGTYNFGFCAVKSSGNTLNFLHWWQAKLERDCIVDMDRGIFVDQSWIDLVPGLFDNVAILRHPGYNVAYWNLAQRQVVLTDSGQWASNGLPLVFFHYSGFNPLNPEPFSKHQNRFTLSNLGIVATLVSEYADCVIVNGAEYYSKLPYGFGVFEDGTRIPDLFRKSYLNTTSLRKRMGDNPFKYPEALSWNLEQNARGSISITWAMSGLWESRKDLQRAFHLDDDESAYSYWAYFLHEAETYFSESVVEKHKSIFQTISPPQVHSIHLKPNAAMTVQAIFMHLLGRDAGSRGLKYLGPLCQNKIGACLAVVIVAATRESRARGYRLARLKKALKRVIASSKSPADIPRPSHIDSRQKTAYTGIYPTDSDSTVSGLWCSQAISIPMPEGPHQSIEIIGTYIPELHKRATNAKTVEIRLLLDNVCVYKKILPDSGEINISIPVAEGSSGAKLLHVELSSSFVPSQIKLNGDVRSLAWRITKASTGSCVMVDAGRKIQLLPLSEIRTAGGINLVGYLAAELGVGEAARSMAMAAKAADIPYSIIDVGHQSSNRQSDRSAWQQAENRNFDIDIIYVNADQTPDTLRYLDSIGHPSPKARIGYWHWEQPKLPEKYLSAFAGLDEIWVPTAFVLEAVTSISPIPVFKVPHAVEFSVDTSITRSSFGIPENAFAVLVMYDFHSYKYRKNPEAAIAAYKSAAGHTQNACLVIKTINAHHYTTDYDALKQSVEGLPSVIFLDEVFSRDKIYALEANCDCMISLHRAEGFGLGPAEMMYLGKPVIATGWSGNMEFMNNMNSFPVNYCLKPLDHSVGVYESGIEWAEPDIEHAAHCLAKLLADPSLSKQIGNRARTTIKTSLNSKIVGLQYRARLALVNARS